METLYIAWTTVNKPETAQKLAKAAVEAKLSCCVQIDGPIASFYSWEGRIERDQEYRLLFKFTASREPEITQWIADNHPYDTPEWIVLAVEKVAPGYLKWATNQCS